MTKTFDTANVEYYMFEISKVYDIGIAKLEGLENQI